MIWGGGRVTAKHRANLTAQPPSPQVDGLGKTERDVAKLMKQLKEVEEAVGRHKAARREVKRLQATAAESDAGLRELAAQEQSLRRQADSTSSRAAELENRPVSSLSPLPDPDPRTTCVRDARGGWWLGGGGGNQ